MGLLIFLSFVGLVALAVIGERMNCGKTLQKDKVFSRKWFGLDFTCAAL